MAFDHHHVRAGNVCKQVVTFFVSITPARVNAPAYNQHIPQCTGVSLRTFLKDYVSLLPTNQVFLTRFNENSFPGAQIFFYIYSSANLYLQLNLNESYAHRLRPNHIFNVSPICHLDVPCINYNTISYTQI